MTVRVTINRVCDRCQKPFEGEQIEYGDKLPEYDRSKLTLTRETTNGKTGEVEEKILLCLSDLCPQCEGVVDKAVAKLRMDPVESKSKSKASKALSKDDRRAKAAEVAKLAAAAASSVEEEELSDPPDPTPSPCATPMKSSPTSEPTSEPEPEPEKEDEGDKSDTAAPDDSVFRPDPVPPPKEEELPEEEDPPF